MTYRVIVQRAATEDLLAAYQWSAERAPLAAIKWLERFEQSLQTLAKNPQRCALAKREWKSRLRASRILIWQEPVRFSRYFHDR